MTAEKRSGPNGRAHGKEREHAVVIGAGFAGLLAARVLGDFYEQVTIVERDRLPERPSSRKGVPQASHVHTLFPRGRLIVEGLFPGIQSEVLGAGVRIVDPCQDFAWLGPFGWGLRFPSSLGMYMSSRDLLEWCVRNRLARQPRIAFLDGCDVARLLVSSDQKQVAGVVLRERSGSDAGAPERELAASLVIDASGRGSQAPRWLEGAGYPKPIELVVDASQGYSSRIYRQPPNYGRSWQILYVQQAPPDCTRGGIMTPIEQNQLLVTLAGTGGDVPPGDEQGFLEFARSLRSSALYETIKNAAPLSPITKSRSTNNRRRLYEKLSPALEGFVVVGDAFCAFNPVYGQGISTAALGAMALQQCLERGPERLAGRVHAKTARIIGGPWTLATGEDLRVRGATGARPPGLSVIHRYLDHAQALGTRSQAMRQALIEVFTMMKPLPSLFRPSVSGRIVSNWVAGKPLAIVEAQGVGA